MRIVRIAIPVPIPQLFDYIAEDVLDTDVGKCVRVAFGRGEKTGLIVALPEHSDVPAARLKPLTAIQRDVPSLPADWIELVSFVARYYHAPIGEVIALALPPGLRRADAIDGEDADPLLALTADGRAALAGTRRESRALQLLRRLEAHGPTRRSLLRAELPSSSPIADALARGWLAPTSLDDRRRTAAAPTLTDEQQAALSQLRDAGPGFCAWLLHGVTGSGKTEVYLKLVADALAAGRQALMLVPEIALTPQLEQRVQARFPDARIVSLHSAQADGARSRGFVQALCGHADIVLGTRLAVFTPIPRLAVIVIDEEHDASYAQLEGVRYSARDVAVWRARQRAIPVVLGSATPSLESWQHAESGRYRKLELTRRAVATTLPTVRRVDVRRTKLDEGLSAALLEAIGKRLERGEQSLVFLNRRGYAPVLACTACGWVSHCDHCSANQVVHLADGRMRCHHCGADNPIPRACPACGNQDLHAFGRGTQRLEERLAELYPGARVLRVDRDAARTRAKWEALLARIAAGEADILVGTQMMAKGHDFARLTLVGVVGADASLYAADFRAPERLFQQLMQVGGRAGCGELPGEVLIQTEFPDHPLYQQLRQHDYAGFAAMALAERRRAGFPPFSFQAMLRADAPAIDEALEFLGAACRAAEAFIPEGLQLYDPVPMRMTRLARRERAQLLVESATRATLQNFLTEWMAALRALRVKRELRWRIDVDPVDV